MVWSKPTCCDTQAFHCSCSFDVFKITITFFLFQQLKVHTRRLHITQPNWKKSCAQFSLPDQVILPCPPLRILNHSKQLNTAAVVLYCIVFLSVTCAWQTSSSLYITPCEAVCSTVRLVFIIIKYDQYNIKCTVARKVTFHHNLSMSKSIQSGTCVVQQIERLVDTSSSMHVFFFLFFF